MVTTSVAVCNGSLPHRITTGSNFHVSLREQRRLQRLGRPWQVSASLWGDVAQLPWGRKVCTTRNFFRSWRRGMTVMEWRNNTRWNSDVVEERKEGSSENWLRMSDGSRLTKSLCVLTFWRPGSTPSLVWMWSIGLSLRHLGLTFLWWWKG